MISNKSFTPIIAEILEDLAQQGIEELCPSLQRLFNELMKIEREQVLQAEHYERTEQRKGYANGFKKIKIYKPVLAGLNSKFLRQEESVFILIA